MTQWNLPELFRSLGAGITEELESARTTFGHSTTKGDATEAIWQAVFEKYLPERYVVSRAVIVDSCGVFSDQIDIVIYDRQYNPFVLVHGGQRVVPAESVYAAFEVKQTANNEAIKYAENKLRSVRRLTRRFRSLNPKLHPVPNSAALLGGHKATPVLGGLLATHCKWKKTSIPLTNTSSDNHTEIGALDIGCIAKFGYFTRSDIHEYKLVHSKAPVIGFMFRLIRLLQEKGTVSMIDMDAYADILEG